MPLVATLATAFEQLRIHPLRALLTMLGIIIGVTSTILVVSVLQGFTQFVSGQLRGFGTNAMWVWPE
jgi:putative ABC transport system permease protein